ncbi:phage tail assembly protein [Methylobacterium sp. SI9]|uniref:phage tail assembly protein n=1 Tax=Methylobacterium guangdongense TaxID=3138811 RepID=UPI00313B6761
MDGFTDAPQPTPVEQPAPQQIDDQGVDMPDGGVRYRLRQPVQAPGPKGIAEVTEIVCRRPTGMDILQVGNPVLFDPGRAQITHDIEKMPLMIFRLSSVTPAVLGKMTSEDLTGLFWAVTRFFLPPVGSI